MPTAADIRFDEQVRVLVFGKFKTGKTAGAATFPRPNFLSFDQGMATVASKWWREAYPSIDLATIRYENFHETKRDKNGIPLKHNAYDDACRYFDEWMKKSGSWKSPYDGSTTPTSVDDFDTWVIDSGTTLSSVAMTKGIMLLGDPGFAGKALSNTYSAAQKAGMIVPKQQDFGAERSLVEQFVRMVYDSGKHVVLICHEKEVQNEAGAVTDVVPLFTGQSSERIPIMFDEVYQLEAKKSGPDLKRTLRTKSNGIVRCGTRMGVPDGTAWNWDAVQAAIGSVK